MSAKLAARTRGVAIASAIVAALLIVGSGGNTARADTQGSKFLLGGTAQLAPDPENPSNDVIRIRTDVAPFFGTVSRSVNVKVHKLDNMLEFKSRFENDPPSTKTCFGGAPRFQLAIDTDGDGRPNGNAFGYFGASPNFAGCPQDTWLYEDLTGAGDAFITGVPLFPSPPQLAPPNEELEWDLTQFGGAFYNTWSQVEAFFTAFPKHLVCTVALVDDAFAPPMIGTAHYDVISAGRATWVDKRQIGGRGFARGCGHRNDDDDDDDDDDHDHDSDVDEHDDLFDLNRREKWGQ
jgi:hypothetical protein